MDQWLADFAFKITIEWWVFPLGGSLSVLTALLTIGFQSIKAALISPAKSIKTE
jgi:putative ABC transport system permease protein